MPDGSAPIPGSRAIRRYLEAEARRRARRELSAGQPRSASARLILDPLEPRVLLNADTLAVQVASLPIQTRAHDVLVQTINDTITVGARTQTVQRVQVVDQTSGGAILAMGDLSEIRAISISVPSGADKITLDMDSFGTNAAPKLAVQGDGLTGPAIDHAASPVTWQVNGNGSGTATGAGANLSFTGVNALTGGAGGDVLDGRRPIRRGRSPAPVRVAWRPTPAVRSQPSMPLPRWWGRPTTRTHSICIRADRYPASSDGGAGGYDTLAYVGGQYAGVVATATGPGAGNVTADGVTTDYTGLEPVLRPQMPPAATPRHSPTWPAPPTNCNCRAWGSRRRISSRPPLR